MSSEAAAYAIRAQGLSKQYAVGTAVHHDTLRDAISAAVGRWIGSHRTAADPAATFWALRDMTFEIPRGSVVGIVGRNGAGKSTLLKILSRVTLPTHGYLEGYGRVGSLLEVGTGFHPELTGRENVFLSGAILGMKRAEIRRKFATIAEFAEIDRFLDTPVKHYSSGMYVRLGFAVAAHLEPDILVIDEVLAVGDAPFQAKCLTRMREIAASGCTILFVSHNMSSVRRLCQRALWLEDGTLQAEGESDSVIPSYLQSLESASTIPLSERAVRGGTGEVRLLDIQTCNPRHPDTCVLCTGEPAAFRFSVTSGAAEITCSFTIYDGYGQPVTYFDSATLCPHDLPSSAPDYYECLVDELLLLPGKYRVNAALTRKGQLLDHLEAACFFRVAPSLLRDRPVAEQGAYGSMQMPHRWTTPAH